MTGEERRADRRSAVRRRAFLGTVAGSTAAVAGCLGDTEFTIADVSGPTDRDAPLSFAVDVVDPDVLVDSPGAFELTAINDADEPLELVSRGVRPFGVLELRGESDDYGDAWIDLWADAYAESEHVDVKPNGMGVDGEDLVTRLESGDSVSFDYEIRGDDVTVSEGTYELRGDLGDDAVARYRRPNEEDDGNSEGEADDSDGNSEPSGTGLDPEIEFRIETRSKIPFR